MTIRLQAGSHKRLYEQIYEYVKQEIIDGKLLAGERLPSTRSLAENLQIARSTVDAAYAQLVSEGYIEPRAHRGYFVCSVEELLQLQVALSGENMEGGALRGQVLTKGEESAAPLIDFSPFAIDMSGFPLSVWKKLSRKVLTDANLDLFAKGDAQGDGELRRSISRYLHSARGVNCDPDQIIVGAGNEYLLMLLEKILGKDIKIAMENPTYGTSYRIFQSFGYDVATLDMDESGMRVDQLTESGAKVAYVMPSHQFPTGTVMPIGRRMELLKWANGGRGRYLIEDDYDSEYRHKGRPIPALQSTDKAGKVIYMGTFSKAIAPAIRVSFMVLPQSLLEKYKKDCGFYSCTVSRIDQSILNEFIRDGYFERHLNKMRKIYREKHDLLLECLKPLRDSFEISGENAGLHILLTSKKGISEQELKRRALQAGVKVYGLSDGMQGDVDRSTVLMGFGGLTPEEIQKGTGALRNVYKVCK